MGDQTVNSLPLDGDIPSHLFSGIPDELLGQLSARHASIFDQIRSLMGLLDLDTYAEMNPSARHDLERLRRVENELGQQLIRPVASIDAELPAEPDRAVLQAFAGAYLLERLYPKTVGDPDEILSTLELRTLPDFRVRDLDDSHQERAFTRICEELSLLPDEVAQLRSEASEAESRIDRRTVLVDRIRALVERQSDSPSKPTRSGTKALFDRYYPNNPLRKEEIDLVVTRTCLYWAVPGAGTLQQQETFGQTRTPEEQAQTLDFLKGLRRFSFRAFSHFPTFSSFDARDADPSLIDELAADMDCSRSEIVSLLSAVTTVETTEDIEKYLIHDTWGHIWQADLSRLGSLYDRMESLVRAPISANDILDLEDGTCATLVDILYLNRDGHIAYDADLADRVIDAWLRVRVESVLSPIVAELAADVIEFKFRLDNPTIASELPSSSLFADNPAKLDFAWVDIGYFIRTLKKTNLAYGKSQSRLTNLVESLRLTMRTKYARHYRKIESKEALEAEIEDAVVAFLERFESRQDQHLNQDLDSEDLDGDEDPEANSFFLLFTNFLQIQFTLNDLIEKRLAKENPELVDHFTILTIFLTRHFQTAPLARFWDLDETLANYSLPLLNLASKCEKQTAREGS